MNNEIKEMISDLQRVADRKCYPEDILCGSIAQEWIDYITDLQQEINELKAKLEMYENGVYFSSENDELQQRIDKAIEYIKRHQQIYDIDGSEDNKIDEFDILAKPKTLLNILGGSDKE